MARIRVFIVLALAVAAGGTFAYGTYQYMQNGGSKGAPAASIPTSAVIVAKSPSVEPVVTVISVAGS